jgi:hypothetical protein
MLASSTVDCDSNPGRVKPKTIKLVFASPLGKDELSLNQDNVSERSDMSTNGVMFL